MYALEMAEVSDPDWEMSIADWCRQFGPVASVRTLGHGHGYTIALVKMSASVDPQKLLLCIGEASVEVEALIVLEQ